MHNIVQFFYNIIHPSKVHKQKAVQDTGLSEYWYDLPKRHSSTHNTQLAKEIPSSPPSQDKQ